MRRIARFDVTPDVLLFMGSGKFQVIANPLPEDAVQVGAFFDAERHTFSVIVQSASFKPLEESEPVPYITPPTITRID